MSYTFLAQIISFAILFLGVIGIAWIVPKISRKISAFITWRRSFILAGVYLGVLILLVPMLYILPTQGFIAVTDSTQQVGDIAQKRIIDFFNAELPSEFKLNEQLGLYQSSNQTFNVDSKKLTFSFLSESAYPILVETKNVDDGKIEVSTYLPPNRLPGGVDYTRLLLPPTISLQNGTLTFKSRAQALNFNQFKTDFTINQFTGLNKGSIDWNSTFFGYGSGRIIFIQVPKGLEVDLDKYKGQVQMLTTIK